MYQVSNGGSFNRIHHWQQIERTPSSIPLTVPLITSLTQSISEENRMEMFRLRAARVGDGDLCALDSTTQTEWGASLADIMYGRNKFDICKVFGFEVPEGCDAKYKPKKTRERKVGRPKKARPVTESKG